MVDEAPSVGSLGSAIPGPAPNFDGKLFRPNQRQRIALRSGLRLTDAVERSVLVLSLLIHRAAG